MGNEPGVRPVRRFDVRLSATPAQWAWAVAIAGVAWFLLYRFAHDNRQYLKHGAAGFALYLVEIGYLIFLRSQWSTLEVDGAEVRLLKEHLPRSSLRLELGDWYRIGARGAAIALHSGASRVVLGVKAQAELPKGSAWSCDALISRSDAEELLECLEPGGSRHLVPKVVSAYAPRRAGALAGMAPWFLTIALLGAFGVGVGVYFPTLVTTAEGRLFVHTVVLGGIAAGLVTTMTGWHERTGTFRPREEQKQAIPLMQPVRPAGATGRPTFARSAANMASWMVASLLIAAALFAPLYGIQQLLRHHVDMPACAADCSARGLEFQDYRWYRKGSFCDCRGETGPITLRASYNITGGQGVVHDLVNGLFRFTAIVGGTLLWAAGLFAAAFTLWPKVRGKLKR